MLIENSEISEELLKTEQKQVENPNSVVGGWTVGYLLIKHKMNFTFLCIALNTQL